jgi:DNA (cytosine-5)-methyltransferase 1
MFTPREVARIQSFPDDFYLLESKTTNYKALGNAVPPVLMWHLTKAILKALN